MRMDTTLWEESLSHGLKVERNLNFSTISNEEDEYGYSRKKAARDPMSHRIIEKRRRDRMNNCLADLSRLVPTNYLKKGRGRIEKTEIIEMAIKHLKHLQAHPCKDMSTCEVAKVTEQDHKRQYSLGFHECLSETVRFLVEIEGLYAGDGLCVRLVSHLQKHYDKVAGGVSYTQALSMMQSEDSKISPMDIESNHGHPPQLDGFPDAKTPGPLDAPQAGLAAETASNGSRPSEVFSSSDALKHEQDVNSNHAVGSVQEHADYASPPTSGPATATVKVASQLREMLQNPGLPKESLRHGNGSSIPAAQLSSYHSPVNGTSSNTTPLQQQHHTSHSQPSQHQQLQQQQQPAKTEEVYKFKNNIKHRFNADLRQHTASPTDSHHSDRVSLPDEERTASDHRHSSAHAVGPEDNRLVVPSVLHNGHSNGHHRPFSDFHPPPHSELSVKIPDRGADEPGHPHWECHAETGSSCGSNPSTPPVARSNGSSSGYSTGGEMPPASKFKTPGPHSPATSPYSRTPDHVVNRSPSPAPPPPPPVPQHQVTGVPIFALHPKGTFYIPLTIDASFIAPYILGTDELAPVLHPVSICVNFNLCHSFKVEKLNGSACHYRTQSYFVDRFSDRFVYGDRPRL